MSGSPKFGLSGVFRFLLGLFALLAAMPAHAQTTQYTNTSTGTINDVDCGGTPVTRTFVVGTSYTISDVNLGVLLSHTYRSDLRITLQSPAGTTVNVMTNTAGSGDNLHDLFDDEAAANISTHDGTVTDPTAPTPPPYSHSFQPTSALSAFDGQNALGTWTMVVCDSVATDVGTFQRADLYITRVPTSYTDLSLTKTVSSATPVNGAAISYTLNVTNSASATLAASGVVVKDILPAGVSFVSSSGFGSYNSGTGDWTVGAIPIGTTRTLTINVSVSATSGATVSNVAEVKAQDQTDLDSTSNNGVTTEDDYASVNFTVSGTRAAGTPPTLSCPAGTTIFDWSGKTWTSGALSGSYTQTGVGTFSIGIVTDTGFASGPLIGSTLTGGLGTAEVNLFLNMNNNAQTDKATTTITLPGTVPGLQFRIFDVDFSGTSYTDKITVTGKNGASTVLPTLTNGVSNYVAGNVAIGDAGATDTTADGTVFVTFTSAVDTLIIEYGNHTNAPANPGNQYMGIHDITFCNALPSITMLKSSVIVNNGVDPALATPGNDAMYSIQLSNNGLGPVASNSMFLLDTLPAEMTFFNGDANGAAAGTDPVLFTDASSGLSAFNYATDVRYSNLAAAPANFAACTYTPAAGYDANVKHVCINPKGIMSGKTTVPLIAAPSFTIQFRTRIK